MNRQISPLEDDPMDTRQARLAQGRAKRQELWGPQPPLDPSYELQELMTEVLFGEVWSRPGLDARSREIATLAALTVLGWEAQLRSQIEAALNIGLTRQENANELLRRPSGGPERVEGRPGSVHQKGPLNGEAFVETGDLVPVETGPRFYLPADNQPAAGFDRQNAPDGKGRNTGCFQSP